MAKAKPIVVVNTKSGVIWTDNLFCDEKDRVADKKVYVTPKISMASGDANANLVASTSLKLDAHKYAKMRDLNDLNLTSRSKFEVFLPSTNLKSKFSYVQADTNKSTAKAKGQLVSMETFDSYFSAMHELSEKVKLDTWVEFEKIHLEKKYDNLHDSQSIYFNTKLTKAFSEKLSVGPLGKCWHTRIKKPKSFSSQCLAIHAKYEASGRWKMEGHMGLQLLHSHSAETINAFIFKGEMEYILSLPSKIVAEIKQKMDTTMEGNVFQKTSLAVKFFLLWCKMLALRASALIQYNDYKDYERHDRLAKLSLDFRVYFGRNRYIDIISYQFARNRSNMAGKSYGSHSIGAGIFFEF
ncbi:MAG: hypothetical protein LBH49_03655 [Puniceicoccales bacterium]|jgi:hypothetical protein|nr:hypothetical protein [Puniceicoccales bacterium]